MGSKILQGSAGVNQRWNSLEMRKAIEWSQCCRALCSCRCSSIIKIMDPVCVCIYVCPAIRFAMLWGIELKVGMGVGGGPTRFVGIFSKWPHLGSKVIQRSICLRNALWLPNLVGRIPDQRVMHCWGQRSCRGRPGSNCLEMPYGHQIWWEESLTKS